ncbi:MAG TPA: pseudouridine-5'-phosphate glycosidase [Pyrinomonadaceae bacterium]|nr:pseudouridine-5'-phosphate glycosidase [Pyrinomonadaceae bacterium]
MFNRNLFHLSAEVEAALAEGRAVVALESTVIAHGLPRPLNLDTAHRLQQVVREGGAIPATIAVLDGKLTVGLDDAQIERIADEGHEIHKLSRRDLSIAVARGWDGATTVATTMWIARQAGIAVFATGGIGGVHRGALADVSADLPELARTPMVVVCSGAKIVLDIAATREWLETYGVTVIGYECNEMPAFYMRRSGLPIDVRADSAREVATLARARNELGLEGAILVTVPVPIEAEVEPEMIEAVLNEALDDAKRLKIGGRGVTPFLLERMGERTGGATLAANVALLENNARIAAEIARALLE